MKAYPIVFSFLFIFYSRPAIAGLLNQAKIDASDGGGIFGYALIFISLYIIGMVCLFIGSLLKFVGHSFVPMYFKKCLQISEDQIGIFVGAAFFLHIIFGIPAIIIYCIIQAINSKNITTSGFITAIVVGWVCAIIVVIRICLRDVKTEDYF